MSNHAHPFELALEQCQAGGKAARQRPWVVIESTLASLVARWHWMSHPPKPRLTFRIGITGHRLNRLAPRAPGALKASVRTLLTDVRAALEAARTKHASVFSDQTSRLIIVSSLAEGADRVVAEVARELGLELFCPLPFERQDYERDFEAAESRTLFHRLLGEASVFELDGTRQDEERAYESAGLFVLRQSDMVIAVWDGKPGAGRGGTHDIVQSAVSAGIPIVRFDENGAGPWLLRPAEGGATANARDLITGGNVTTQIQLAEIVALLVQPPRETEDEDARDRLDQYFAERERLKNYWFAYPVLLRLFASKQGVRKSFHPAAYLASTGARWQEEFWQPIAGACSLDWRAANKAFTPANIAEALQPRFAWADGLAVYYGQSYRSSYVLAFLLGTVAVFFAVFPLLLTHFSGSSSWRYAVEFWCAFLALIEIGSVVVLVLRGRQSRRHEKWVDYRLLAERLRVIRVLALTASPMPELRMPHADESLKSQQSWVAWYVRATLREIGMPKGSGSSQYAELVKCALLAAELKGQAAFHRNYAARERSLGSRLERVGVVLFMASAIVTFLALVYFGYMAFWRLAGEAAEAGGEHRDVFADVAMLVAALFPAAGAAFFSIRSHGEFERNARLSESVHERLAAIIARVERNTPPTFASVARATDETAAVLTGELADWRFIFWGKPLTLPG